MQQSQALNILKMGENVFLTGQAGSGKTYVLNEYIKYLKQKNIPVGITASTGVAATHLNGITLHSWSGIGIKDKLTKQEIGKLLKKRYLRKHYLETAVLIIDEISMLHAQQLDLVNQLCQIFRQDLRPFGGLQVVLSGDFFQLPPVGKDGDSAKFAFDAEIWQKMNLRFCYLNEQFRQDDLEFLNVLNEIRSGQVSPESYQLLSQRKDLNFNVQLEPTKLYTHNIDVDAINFFELGKIKSGLKKYEMQSRGNKNLVEVLKKSCLAPEKLMLKIGAKVMFVKNNFELGVVNGTVGEVVNFDELGYPEVRVKTGEVILVEPGVWNIEENNNILAQIKQIPLRLAWALTVHKSQGMSLDLAEIDLSKSFEPGMGYVALSRVRGFLGLKLIAFNEMALKVNSQILSFDQRLQKISDQTVELLEKLSEIKIKSKHDEFVQKNAVDFVKKTKKKKNYLITLELVNKKMSLPAIAAQQGFKLGTIIKHLEKLILSGKRVEIDYLMPDQKNYQKIKKAFEQCGLETLKPVYDYLNEKYDYDELRLVRLFLQNQKSKK